MSNWQKISTTSNGYSTEILRNDEIKKVKQALIVGTASTGMVREEWIQARYGQIIPTNWSWVQMWQYMGIAQGGAFFVRADPGRKRATVTSRGEKCTIEFDLALSDAGAYRTLGPYPCAR